MNAPYVDSGRSLERGQVSNLDPDPPFKRLHSKHSNCTRVASLQRGAKTPLVLPTRFSSLQFWRAGALCCCWSPGRNRSVSRGRGACLKSCLRWRRRGGVCRPPGVTRTKYPFSFSFAFFAPGFRYWVPFDHREMKNRQLVIQRVRLQMKEMDGATPTHSRFHERKNPLGGGRDVGYCVKRGGAGTIRDDVG